MFVKISQEEQIYTTSLSKADFDRNEAKIQQEINKITKDFPEDKQIVVKVKFDNKDYKLKDFLKLLKQQVYDLKYKKDVKENLDTSLFQNIGGKNVDISSENSQDSLKKKKLAYEKSIQISEENLAAIDKFVVDILTGDLGQLNIAHTNAKFIKIAEDELVKEADEEIEDYYNELYKDTPGNPPYGSALEHYEENRNKLTEDIKTHASSKLQPKFKKK